ncbi:hypothetical protein ABBQ38_000917 [Trebouxia sp. C0009 RCD-2024]
MVTGDLQMLPHQHHPLEEKPVFGKADVHIDDPVNERIDKLESTLRYMAKTVSNLMNEKAIYLRQNRQLQSSNNLLALKVQRLEEQLAASAQNKALSGRQPPRYSAMPSPSAAGRSLRPSLLAQLKGNRTPAVPKWLSSINQASSRILYA